MMRIQNNN